MLLCVTVIIAFVVAMSIGRYANAIGSALKLMDHPDQNGGRKRHVRVTPLVGGLGVTLAAVPASLVIIALAPRLGGETIIHLGWLAFAVSAMFMIGAADDRFNLGPLTRLLSALVIMFPVVIFASGFDLTSIRLSGMPTWSLAPWMAAAFALLCLLALLNAVNMADGKNGVVISLGLVWSVVLMVRLPSEMLPLTAAVATALAVLLFFNMNNRLFLGDGGSYAVSAFFGLLAIYGYNRDAALRADDIILMFAIPIFDTFRLIVMRSLQRQSPFQGGRDHLHHFLFAKVGWPNGLYVLVALAGLPNLAALLMPGTTPFWLLGSAVGYGVICWWAQQAAALAIPARAIGDHPVIPIESARKERFVRVSDTAGIVPKRAIR